VAGCAASGLFHLSVLAALAAVRLDRAMWQFSVQQGEPIVLVASLGPASPASAIKLTVDAVPPMPPTETPLDAPEPPRLATRREMVDALPAPIQPAAPEPIALHAAPPARRDRIEDVPQEPLATPPKTARRPMREMSLPTVMQAEIVSTTPPSIQVLDAGAQVDQPPRNLPTNPAPDYPLEARRAGWEGRVMLLVSVNVSGLVEDAKIHESSGYAVLDDAALSAVRRWRFAAARKGVRAVASDVLVPIRFSLRR
jgi:protein TonB